MRQVSGHTRRYYERCKLHPNTKQLISIVKQKEVASTLFHVYKIILGLSMEAGARICFHVELSLFSCNIVQ